MGTGNCPRLVQPLPERQAGEFKGLAPAAHLGSGDERFGSRVGKQKRSGTCMRGGSADWVGDSYQKRGNKNPQRQKTMMIILLGGENERESEMLDLVFRKSLLIHPRQLHLKVFHWKVM